MNDILHGDVTIQDAQLLYDMNLISSEEFTKFTRAKALMVKNTVKLFNDYCATYMDNIAEEEISKSSNVIS